MRNNHKIYLWALLAVIAVMSSCSTTKRLLPDEVLYNGVKKFEVKAVQGEKVPAEVDDYLFDAIDVKPNNSLYSPYLRTPFPLGLWVHCSL